MYPFDVGIVNIPVINEPNQKLKKNYGDRTKTTITISRNINNSDKVVYCDDCICPSQ